jgi:endopeptidase Clp ATP-binding regulatory subunit ClpX
MDKGDDRPATPEELSRQLADFMKANFPGAVAFKPFQNISRGHDPDQGKEPDEASPTRNAIFEFQFRPRDIKAHLDRFVIKQDEAKKALAIAVCDHYNHAKYLKRLEEEDPALARKVEIAKQNVIIVGPTGVGKTYLVKHIADLIGVPFVKADATKFSETGYVGADVDDLIRELVQKAQGDVALAEYGIVYIDEIDKLATRGSMIGRDVSGRGVQTTLLKLMEETEVPLRSPSDLQGQMQAMFDLSRGKGGAPTAVNTRNILFIASGAFSGLETVISERLRQGTMGFGADRRTVGLDNELFRNVTTRDFLEFGFEAEFIGRLPVRVVCEPLQASDLFTILKDSEGSLVHQYERDFDAFGIRVRFEDSGLREISAQAEREQTGARGLVTVCERLLRDFKFELPGTSVTELVVDAALVQDPAATLRQLLAECQSDFHRQAAAEVDLFCRDFQDKHGLTIVFDEEAVEALSAMARADCSNALQVCKRLFRDYQFGLGLIQKNTGQSEFRLPLLAVTSPSPFLSDLVVQSYGRTGSAAGDSGPDAPSTLS